MDSIRLKVLNNTFYVTNPCVSHKSPFDWDLNSAPRDSLFPFIKLSFVSKVQYVQTSNTQVDLFFFLNQSYTVCLSFTVCLRLFECSEGSFLPLFSPKFLQLRDIVEKGSVQSSQQEISAGRWIWLMAALLVRVDFPAQHVSVPCTFSALTWSTNTFFFF